MSDDSISSSSFNPGRACSFDRTSLREGHSRGGRAHPGYARPGEVIATLWRYLLLAIVILEIPLQLDTYLFHDLEDARFGAISGFNISITTFCLAFLYLQWLPRVIVESRRLLISKSLVAFVAISAITIVWAADKSRTVYEVFLLTQAFLIFFYVINNLKTRGDAILATSCLAIGLLIQGLFMVATRVAGSDIGVGPLQFQIHELGDRVTGSLASPNVASSYIALLLMPCISLFFIRTSRLLRVVAALAILFGGAGLVLTLSRGGWVAAAVSMGFFCTIAAYKRWLSPRACALFLLVIAVTGIAVGPLIAERLFGDDNGSAMARFPLNQLSQMIVAENPLGVGANNWDVVAKSHAEKSRIREAWFYFVHNKYLLVLAEVGWLGLLAFVTFLGSIVFCGWRAINSNLRLVSPLALGFTAAFVGQLVHMSMDVFNSRAQTQMLLLVAAMVIVTANIAARSVNDEPDESVSSSLDVARSGN